MAKFLFFKSFLLVLTNFNFGEGIGQEAVILWSLVGFLTFPNFPRSLVLTRLETRDATRT